MLASDIANRVKRRFGDESGVQLTDDDIIKSINDAQRKIVRRSTSLLEVTATSSSVGNTQEYNLPTNLFIFRMMMYKGSSDTAYRKMQGMSLQEFNEYIDGWDQTTSDVGVPTTYSLHANKFLVYPVPTAAVTNAFKLYYVRRPTDIVSLSDTPDLPEDYHTIIMDLVLKDAYEMDEDWEAAGNKSQEANVDINYLQGNQDWKQTEVYPSILVRIEDL